MIIKYKIEIKKTGVWKSFQRSSLLLDVSTALPAHPLTDPKTNAAEGVSTHTIVP